MANNIYIMENLIDFRPVKHVIISAFPFLSFAILQNYKFKFKFSILSFG